MSGLSDMWADVPWCTATGGPPGRLAGVLLPPGTVSVQGVVPARLASPRPDFKVAEGQQPQPLLCPQVAWRLRECKARETTDVAEPWSRPCPSESPLRSFLGDAHPLVVVAGIFFAQICCLLCWYWGLISGLE